MDLFLMLGMSNFSGKLSSRRTWESVPSSKPISWRLCAAFWKVVASLASILKWLLASVESCSVFSVSPNYQVWIESPSWAPICLSSDWPTSLHQWRNWSSGWSFSLICISSSWATRIVILSNNLGHQHLSIMLFITVQMMNLSPTRIRSQRTRKTMRLQFQFQMTGPAVKPSNRLRMIEIVLINRPMKKRMKIKKQMAKKLLDCWIIQVRWKSAKILPKNCYIMTFGVLIVKRMEIASLKIVLNMNMSIQTPHLSTRKR